ncbi:hypothetical protein MIND_01407900 [Mycena indigotica]|uniref:Uncharacterized protein n=1 Tax=Mycena indigotica TaxID=2126181 RepID=A0A8H6VP50_9AGAR|nr:uncharacterized protein MIND_01407900 [Mycena indigotica]KAF7288917.1 hypothetical protein MIND_01407900 [Mycena indigotica]
MLFLLAYASASAHSRSGHWQTALADECTDINNCRRLFDIVWGCLATIFLCIWVSVHPNIPPPTAARPERGAGFWRRAKWQLVTTNGPLLQRVKLMAAALIAPEIIVGMAAKQAIMAQSFAREFHISLTHGFFLVMGGFADADGHPIVTVKQLMTGDVVQEIHATRESDIADKSKGDVLSKGIALCQGIWFIAQFATLAFATLNGLTWLLWLPKPLDVRNPIQLSATTMQNEVVPVKIHPPSISWSSRFTSVFMNLYEPHVYDPLSATSVPTFWCTTYTDYERLSEHVLTLRTVVFSELLCGSLFGAVHCPPLSKCGSGALRR